MTGLINPIYASWFFVILGSTFYPMIIVNITNSYKSMGKSRDEFFEKHPAYRSYTSSEYLRHRSNREEFFMSVFNWMVMTVVLGSEVRNLISQSSINWFWTIFSNFQ